MRRAVAGLAAALLAGLAAPALAQPLRIGMTASNVPTTNGAPDNGFEGMRSLGYPVFEGLVLWDLARSDVRAGLRPGLAERWEQDPNDPRTWIFHLRQGVKFQDGADFNADVVIWNLDRFFRQDSPQFDAAGSALARSRASLLASYRKVDDRTVALTTTTPASYFPYMAVYLLFVSPQAFEANGRDWAKVAQALPAGTGPFRLSRFTPRVSAELVPNPNYWDAARRPKVERIIFLPIPDAVTRVSALRSGQVDWIEAPPPEAIPSLRQAGFNIVTNPYPMTWSWMLNLEAPNTPFADVRVRRALNYCVDRDGVGQLLNGTSEPAVGILRTADSTFGEPENRYRLDPARARALLAEAGYNAQNPLRFKVVIPTSGSGMMMPVPMNEFLQAQMRETCGVEVSFEPMDFNAVQVLARSGPDAAGLRGATALNNAPPTSDPAQIIRYTALSQPANWSQYRNPAYNELLRQMETATDPALADRALRAAHEIVVDDAPWVFIAHDLNARAMSRRVQGFVQAQSWFQDFVPVTVSAR